MKLAPTPAAAPPSPPATTPCPKCRKPLTDAAGLGWCQACGYCKSLSEVALPPVAGATGQAPRGALVETGAVIAGMPPWLWVAVINAAAIAAASFAIGKFVALP